MMKTDRSHTIYVDKSALIDDLFHYAETVSRYITIAKPRRFGKTMAANMISAFFTKGLDSSDVFSGLEIMSKPRMLPFMNAFHVFHIDFLTLSFVHSYEEFQRMLCGRIRLDLCEAFPNITVTEYDDVSSILTKTGEKFIFIFDEWDSVFEFDFMTAKYRQAYLVFLGGLFKNRSYVQFALFTGILPIASFSTNSSLNIFHEFNAFDRIRFEQYFGFSEEEIRNLLERIHLQSPTMDEIRLWYDGYVRRSDGIHMFNPDSVSKALTDGFCSNHWTGTGPRNDISNLISSNVSEVRGDIIRLIAHEPLEIKLNKFEIGSMPLQSRNEIISAMVAYGFLTYFDGCVSIPNLELTQKFAHVLKTGSLGVSLKLEESRQLLEATVSEDSKSVASTIERIHDNIIPFIQYSDENSLACVIMVAYYAASDWYDIKREQPSGKGYVDFLFLPVDHNHIPIIMELKYNHSSKAAIEQIHRNHYAQNLGNHSEALLVGINYSERTKKHTCQIERVLLNA